MIDRKGDRLYVQIWKGEPWAWIPNPDGSTRVQFLHITNASLCRLTMFSFKSDYTVIIPSAFKHALCFAIERVPKPPLPETQGVCNGEKIVVEVEATRGRDGGLYPRRVTTNGKPVDREYGGVNTDLWVAYNDCNLCILVEEGEFMDVLVEEEVRDDANA